MLENSTASRRGASNALLYGMSALFALMAVALESPSKAEAFASTLAILIIWSIVSAIWHWRRLQRVLWIDLSLLAALILNLAVATLVLHKSTTVFGLLGFATLNPLLARWLNDRNLGLPAEK